MVRTHNPETKAKGQNIFNGAGGGIRASTYQYDLPHMRFREDYTLRVQIPTDRVSLGDSTIASAVGAISSSKKKVLPLRFLNLVLEKTNKFTLTLVRR